jgi:hypothetical protein
MRAAGRNIGTLKLAALLAAGCSLQDFEYLQQGTGGAGGAGGSATAGSPVRGGSETSGEGGETAGSSTIAGQGGKSSTGGVGGSGGSKPSEGGSGGGNAGTGAVGELVNHSFETGSLMGWTLDPPNLVNDPRCAYVQGPTQGATVPDGTQEFSTWNKTEAFVAELSQTITGIEDGTYVFKGYFNLGNVGFNKVEAFARDCGGTDPKPVAIIGTGNTEWLPIWVKGIEVKGGSCTVGVLVDSQANAWLNADLFTFEPDPDAVGDGGAAGAAGQAGQSGGS